MKEYIIFRDGLEERIKGPITHHTRKDGFLVEKYTLHTGETRFFAIKPGTMLCAHGSTEDEAVFDALWKDEKNRPNPDKLIKEIRKAGKRRKITLNEFRVLTGACKEGCLQAIKNAGHDGSPLPIKKIININREWGKKLEGVLGW